MMKRAGIGAPLLAFLIVLGVFALVVGGCAVSGYNRAISLSERVGETWSQVDVVLQRRHDLIPNLVETVRGYATHERETLEGVIQARAQAVSAQTRDQKVAAETALSGALGRLMVVVERYPELRASENFRDLQQQLEGAENRISIERRRYNQAVRDLNTYVRSFFGRMFTRWAGVGPAEYFEVADSAREAPQVDFGTRPPAAPATGTAPPATAPGSRP